MSYKIPQSVLVVIFTDALDVLLLERADKPGYWQSVTGSKDSIDEAFIETAGREVFEETGIDVREFELKDWDLENIYEIYPVWRHRYEPGVTQNTERVFGLRLPQPVPVKIAPREHLQFAWLPFQQAADQCFSPSNAEAILQLDARYPHLIR